MDLELARRIVAQDAQTSKLLGVDFVPSYRTGDFNLEHVSHHSAHAELRESNPAESSAPVVPGSKVQAPISGPSVAIFEAKPLPPTSSPKAASAIQPADSAVAASHMPRDPNRTAADVERDLAAIRADYERDAPHRAFVTSFNNIVFGEGNPLARIMFVGEAPGEEEDKTGRPFVGRAGQLLDKMIAGMGLKRSDVYIANILKTRPPNNATPTVDECIICMPYIARQIAAIRPEAIVTLGLTSTKALLRTDLTMSRLRGVWASYKTVDGVLIPVMPTFHPAYVLRAYTDENRQKVWSDLKMVLQRLDLPVPARP